jgi:hypothetical protein
MVYRRAPIDRGGQDHVHLDEAGRVGRGDKPAPASHTYATRDERHLRGGARPTGAVPRAPEIRLETSRAAPSHRGAPHAVVLRGRS